jgi:hypothetical protein
VTQADEEDAGWADSVDSSQEEHPVCTLRNVQGALYFPYIGVPDTAWWTRTVLYWDHVATIVTTVPLSLIVPTRLR